jgi:hypothetical protein
LSDKLDNLFVPFSQIDQNEVTSILVLPDPGTWGVAFYGRDGKCYRWLSDGYEQFTEWLAGELEAGRFVYGGCAEYCHEVGQFYDRVANRMTAAV